MRWNIRRDSKRRITVNPEAWRTILKAKGVRSKKHRIQKKVVKRSLIQALKDYVEKLQDSVLD